MAEDVGLNVTVTPVSAPAVKATVPVNGLMSVTVMVTLQLPPWIMVHGLVEGFRVKPPVGEVTVSVKLVVTGASEPEVPVTVIV